MTEAVWVGLVGAGTWAAGMHAPVLAAGPETALAGVWARRPEAAAALAAEHGVPAFSDYDALLDACEAVAFAVPPDVQATMAARAAAAGKALLLDKPIGLDLAQARALTEAVDRAGVVNQLVLSNRYRPRVRDWLADAAALPDVLGARGCMLTGAFVNSPYQDSPWRQEYGSLHDFGPHTLDLLDAAVGRIVRIEGTGDPRGWLALTCTHENGLISQATLTGELETGGLSQFEVFGRTGSAVLDFIPRTEDERQRDAGWATMRAEFAAAVRSGRSHELDVHRGLHLQDLVESALAAVRR